MQDSMVLARLVLALLIAAANPHTHSAACCKVDDSKFVCCCTEPAPRPADGCCAEPAAVKPAGCGGCQAPKSTAPSAEKFATCRVCPCCQNQPQPIAPPATAPESKVKSQASDAAVLLSLPAPSAICERNSARAATERLPDSHQRRQARLAVWRN